MMFEVEGINDFLKINIFPDLKIKRLSLPARPGGKNLLWNQRKEIFFIITKA